MLGLVRSSHAATSAAHAATRTRGAKHGNGILNRTPSDYVGRHAAHPGLWARLTRRRPATRPDFVPLRRIA